MTDQFEFPLPNDQADFYVYVLQCKFIEGLPDVETKYLATVNYIRNGGGVHREFNYNIPSHLIIPRESRHHTGVDNYYITDDSRTPEKTYKLTYELASIADTIYYVGVTNNLTRRLRAHMFSTQFLGGESPEIKAIELENLYPVDSTNVNPKDGEREIGMQYLPFDQRDIQREIVNVENLSTYVYWQ